MKGLQGVLCLLVHFVFDEGVSLEFKLENSISEGSYLEETGSAIEIQVKILDLAEL